MKHQYRNMKYSTDNKIQTYITKLPYNDIDVSTISKV